MNKSKSSRKSEEVKVEPKVEAKVEAVEAPKPEKATKKKNTEAAAPAPVVEKVAEEKPKKARKSKATEEETAAAPVTEDVATEEGDKKARKEVSRESVEAEFNDILELLRESIETASADRKNTSVKVFRALQKRVKNLKVDCLKLAKGKPRAPRAKTTSSGFMKPVKISKDMAKFTGWDADQLRSRVEVTKYICDYIKSNNLQNEKDRRQILPDSKLSKLLSYDAKKDDKPLTYYYLQKKIQPHFVSVEATA